MELLEAVNGRVVGTIPTEQTVSLRQVKLMCYGTVWKRSIPYADKFYLNIHRKSLLKCVALIPPSRVPAGEHLVRKGNLLVIPSREQAHL